mgnify:CR=1 FL=1
MRQNRLPVLLSNKPFKKTENLQKNYRKERSRFLGPENLFGLIPARILRRWFATAAESKGAIPKSPASILFGTQSYKKDWNATQPKQEDGYTWITLTPKAKDASVNSVSFGFKSEKLEKLIFVGSMGEKTNLTISDLKTDVQLSPETFKFTAPKGADVIEVK